MSEGFLLAQKLGALLISVVSVGDMDKGFTTMSDLSRRARLEAC